MQMDHRSVPGRRVRQHSVPGLVAALVLAVAVLTGCSASTEGADVDCSVNSCTATFDRGVNAEVSILGIDVKLVNATDDQVTVDVAGTEVVVPAGGGSQEAGGLAVRVREVTGDTVVLEISRA